MARGGGGGKRDRDDTGPSNNQLKGLSYNKAAMPSFLRDAMTALSGGSGKRTSDGRPPIPTRPGGPEDEDADDDDNKLDERDLGDEAPLVVVLNEKKDLSQAEADLARESAPDQVPTQKGTIAKKGSSLRFSSSDAKSNSSTGHNKRKYGQSDAAAIDEDGGPAVESFDDLVKRAKTDAVGAQARSVKDLPSSAVVAKSSASAAAAAAAAANGQAPNGAKTNEDAVNKEKEKKSLSKEEKAAMKAKRKQAKKLLSFED